MKLKGGYTPTGDVTQCTILEDNQVLGEGIYGAGKWIKDNDSDEY